MSAYSSSLPPSQGCSYSPAYSWSDHFASWYNVLSPLHNYDISPSPPSSLPDLDYPSSPCDSLSASPQYVHVDVPLVVPKPRPYRCLTPIEFDLLPNEDQDLSHPPYTTCSSANRKRAHSELPPSSDGTQIKRRNVSSSANPASGASEGRISKMSQPHGIRNRQRRLR